ncbi:unnamed protein product [Mytilus coruscus]|uniref:Uncharacterized protein n=1 Tax=Mytilus coruscus TaxID=42192 RepID=A0A6J8C365_MYTCO|nr:unnamed protein product [Mytilus coruscus]
MFPDCCNVGSNDWNGFKQSSLDSRHPSDESLEQSALIFLSGSRSRQYLNRIERTVQMVHKFVSASKENIQAHTSPSNVVSIVDRLSTTFETNRRLGTSNEFKRSRGRPTAVLAIKITCLAAPITRVNNLNVSQLKRLGLGYPDAEMTPSKKVPSKLSLGWSWEQLKNFLFESFPVLKKSSVWVVPSR